MKKHRFWVHVLVVCMALMIGALGTVMAQEAEVIEPVNLTGEPVILEFSTGAAGPPTIEPLSDGRMTFRIAAAGTFTGSFEGSMTARVSEVTAAPPPTLHPVTVMFTLETELGTIEGYYAGSLYRPSGADQADITASGHILSVSGAYADLYLADVTVSSQIQFVDGRSVGESGTITIAAR